MNRVIFTLALIFTIVVSVQVSLSSQLSFQEQLVSLKKQKRDIAHKQLKKMSWTEKKALAPQIATYLKDENYQVCNVTAFALGKMGPAAYLTIPNLIETLQNRPDCANVGFALTKIGRAAVPHLINMLKDDNSIDREVSSRTLIKMGYAAKEAIPALKNILLDMDEFYGIEYAPLIARIDPSEIVPYLAKIVSQGEYPIRKDAASILAQLGPKAKSALPELIKALKVRSYFSSEDWRPEVARALGNLGEDAREAVPDLILLLEDSRLVMRTEAAAALEKIGTPQGNSALMELEGNKKG